MTQTVTKTDLAEILYMEVGLNKREASEFVSVFFETIKAQLLDGHGVKLSGFGNFDLLFLRFWSFLLFRLRSISTIK